LVTRHDGTVRSHYQSLYKVHIKVYKVPGIHWYVYIHSSPLKYLEGAYILSIFLKMNTVFHSLFINLVLLASYQTVY